MNCYKLTTCGLSVAYVITDHMTRALQVAQVWEPKRKLDSIELIAGENTLLSSAETLQELPEMDLYKVQCRGYGYFYVLAKDPSKAYNEVNTFLTIVQAPPTVRVLKTIELIALNSGDPRLYIEV